MYVNCLHKHMARRALAALAGFVSFQMAAQSPAQHHSAPGEERPPALLSGLGTYTHAINTENPEAQKFFDQGLILLYGFNRYEALRSFRRAAELDPKAMMPHWGMAMALGPHINMDLDGDVQMQESCKAVRDGQALNPGASERERAYLNAAATRCPEFQPVEYQRAMRELAQRYPDDHDAATFYAESLMIPVRWRWWSKDGKPAERMEEAISVLERVMRRSPEHPGANHFYIHAVEMSPSPEHAISSANRLMSIVPAAGHLVHMSGHIWLRLGDYELAGDVNENAALMDQDYMQKTGVSSSSYVGYYVHNLHFMVYARAMEGRMRDTLQAAEKLAGAASPFASVMPMMVDAFVPAPFFAMIRFQQWDQLLQVKAPDVKLSASTALWHFGRATALMAKDRRREALAEQQAFEKARMKAPPDWIWLNNKASDLLSVPAAILDARLSTNDSDAIAHWRRAVSAEDALSYDEPPPWFYPVRESLGGALLRVGQKAQAEEVFREGLRQSPRNGRILFGLMESLKAQGKTEAAQMVEDEFRVAWKNADVTLRLGDL